MDAPAIRAGIVAAATALRDEMEPHFSDRTCLGAWDPARRCMGQDLAVSCVARLLLAARLGMTAVLMRASTPRGEHVFVRLQAPGGAFDVDLTADQLGLPPVVVTRAGELHPGATEVDEPIFLSPDAYNAVYHLSATMNELLDPEAWPRG